MRAGLRRKQQEPEFWTRWRQRVQARWTRERRAGASQRQKTAMQQHPEWLDPNRTQEARARQAARMKGRRNTPDFVAKLLPAVRASNKRRPPEVIALQVARMHVGLRKAHYEGGLREKKSRETKARLADPEARSRLSQMRKAEWQRDDGTRREVASRTAIEVAKRNRQKQVEFVDQQGRPHRMWNHGERDAAQWLDYFGLRWDYERVSLLLSPGGYLVDFWVGQQEPMGPFIEVKTGKWRSLYRDAERKILRARELGYRVILWENPPRFEPRDPEAMDAARLFLADHELFGRA